MISPVSAAVAGALISGVAVYTLGARTDKVDAFAQQPVAYVQTVDGQYVPVTPAAQPMGFTNALQPAAPAPLAVQQQPAPRQTVYRTAAPVPVQERVVERVVERAPASSGRSWKKAALVIGGSSAAGAGVGGIVDGKKGALIGAAIGGGAASIYEATKR
jgi:hypothetical protein